MNNKNESWKTQAKELANTGELSWRAISEYLGVPKSTVSDYLRGELKGYVRPSDLEVNDTSLITSTHLPKVLVFDLETAPLLSYSFGIWQQNIGLNQIESDWFILSYAAKWLGSNEDEVMYKDLRGIVKEEDDTIILDEMWKLLDEADLVITQNGKKFDVKKINARFVMNGYKPPSPYKHIDTLQIAKANFGFTSNKLEFMTDKLCVKYKKQKHANFSGFALWSGMMKDNIDAWNECYTYNTYDVLSLEELYLKLSAWDNKHPNFNLYSEEEVHTCRCGSHRVVEHGFAYTGVSKFQQYRCLDCGAHTRGRVNLFSKEKMKSLHMNIG